MPIPFLAVAIGAAVVGAIGIGVAAASSSDGGGGSTESWSDTCRNKIKQTRIEFHRHLNKFVSAKQDFNQMCQQWLMNSRASGTSLMLVGFKAESGLNEAMECSEAKFKVILRDHYSRYDEVASETDLIGLQVDLFATTIVAATQTFAMLAAVYRLDPDERQDLVAALNLLLNFNTILMLPLPLFDSSDDASNPSFTINPRFESFINELQEGLDAINQLIDVSASA